MTAVPDSVLARLKRLPMRLRIAHLAALLRHAVDNPLCTAELRRVLSDPSPREALGRVAVAKRRSGGSGNVLARVQLLKLVSADPHPVAHFIRADLESELARLGPHRGEGKESARADDRPLHKGEGLETIEGSRTG